MKNQISGSDVGMAVVIHGKEVAEFPHSDGNTYIWAKDGTEYSVVVWNRTNGRVEVVITVDGLDILGGKTGDYRTQGGYVIAANSKPNPIPGFRLDGDNVARFIFGTPEKSYAALTDRPNNIGVIGAAFFTEQPPRPAFSPVGFSSPYDDLSGYLYKGMCKGGSAESSVRSASVGTGFGRKTNYHTTGTNFVRKSSSVPSAILALHYQDRQTLRSLGIDLRNRPKLKVATTPTPFPAADGCPPPPGWNPRG